MPQRTLKPSPSFFKLRRRIRRPGSASGVRRCRSLPAGLFTGEAQTHNLHFPPCELLRGGGEWGAVSVSFEGFWGQSVVGFHSRGPALAEPLAAGAVLRVSPQRQTPGRRASGLRAPGPPQALPPPAPAPGSTATTSPGLTAARVPRAMAGQGRAARCRCPLQ